MKKLAKNERHQNLVNFYQIVVNKRTGYTKIVPFHKAFEMIHGKMNALGFREHILKDEYEKVNTSTNYKRTF